MISNPDRKMLKDMSDADKGAILAAWWEGQVEQFFGGPSNSWGPFLTTNLIRPHCIYRIRPEPVRMPYVDWSQVGEAVNYIAREKDGYVRAFSQKPNLGADFWARTSAGQSWAIADLFPSYDPGTCDWRDSLISRPGIQG